ncbi:hypothetical protein QCBJ_29735 [Pseudomonas sp. QC2]|uniref:colicin E3/pyocin S6 family cytotoxin n=1 Tax=Pseudomonas sp. QC2 TaxID=2065822 RepID=UPI000C7D2F7F|nr:hypothetical protein QCBJ_29735 [Pseudomonas sp. QC2]
MACTTAVVAPTGMSGKPKAKKTNNQIAVRCIAINGMALEWDSEQGELEVYRYSDVKHLGSFDPYTGEQRGPAKDERRIDK